MQEPHSLQVYKFGGASVKDTAAIRNLCRIVREHAAQQQLLIVVSAMGKTTNALEEIFQLAFTGQDCGPKLDALRSFHLGVAQELFGQESTETGQLQDLLAQLEQQLASLQPPPAPADTYDQHYDQIISFGELLATCIVARALDAQWLDCRPLLRTDHTWREGRIDWPTTEWNVRDQLPTLLQRGPVVTQGFLGGTPNGLTTTLGREGSDYTAAIFAYCLQAQAVTIWKDVAGLLNADPKFFADTVRFPQISYQETIEMAYYGASVIHPKTIKPLAVRQIPLLVKSFLDPTAEGTRIGEGRHEPLAPAFIRKDGQCLISFESRDLTFISEENLEVIFGALAQVRLKINMMQNSAISFSVCTDFSAYRLEKLLSQLRDQFTIHYNTELELYTIKNYDPASLQRLTTGRELLLEQRSRQTFQFVCRALPVTGLL
ncbi:aspartate kinase [Hymenobacter chitinivorans]|uniref:Aspartokinase n=1 Tax=Hymenobacter chitinivorans DSM 11115 TaxID=1121954 RepID=A0A2M9BQE3_9BACT|nr:aspartate kinase [Hymenobacter chitinivorans]PJJ60112.1 aspartate kinase [Hymenobacter chitinivorans DSM 11115]